MKQLMTILITTIFLLSGLAFADCRSTTDVIDKGPMDEQTVAIPTGAPDEKSVQTTHESPAKPEPKK